MEIQTLSLQNHRNCVFFFSSNKMQFIWILKVNRFVWKFEKVEVSYPSNPLHPDVLKSDARGERKPFAYWTHIVPVPGSPRSFVSYLHQNLLIHFYFYLSFLFLFFFLSIDLMQPCILVSACWLFASESLTITQAGRLRLTCNRPHPSPDLENCKENATTRDILNLIYE